MQEVSTAQQQKETSIPIIIALSEKSGYILPRVGCSLQYDDGGSVLVFLIRRGMFTPIIVRRWWYKLL